MKSPKKKNRRQKEKYPNLKPEFNLKSRYEEVADLSYYKKLPDEAKEWLNKFAGEYINASFGTKNPDGSRDHSDNLHDDEGRKACYRRNNYRNKDLFTKVRALGKTVSYESLIKKRMEYEDELINKLDTPEELPEETEDDNEF